MNSEQYAVELLSDDGGVMETEDAVVSDLNEQGQDEGDDLVAELQETELDDLDQGEDFLEEQFLDDEETEFLEGEFFEEEAADEDLLQPVDGSEEAEIEQLNEESDPDKVAKGSDLERDPVARNNQVKLSADWRQDWKEKVTGKKRKQALMAKFKAKRDKVLAKKSK